MRSMKVWEILLFVLLGALIGCGDTKTEPADAASAESVVDDASPGQEQEAQEADSNRAKFEPPEDSVLVFAGQSNDAVGAHDKYNDGYVDHFGMPAGFSHYVGFLGELTSPLGFDFDEDRIEGLSTWDYWGAGPMCLKCYLDDPDFKGTFVHLGLSMEMGSGERLANLAPDTTDSDLEELAAFLKTYSQHPFFLRIGYEFDGEWNAYDPEIYKKAFVRIVDHLRAEGVENFATVFASSHPFLAKETWLAYYPGDEYVDWLGYTWWSATTGLAEDAEVPEVPVAAELAREWGKPILMAEVGPRHHRIGQQPTEEIWAWYDTLFAHIDEYKDVIKGLAIINNHWDPEPMWKDGNWGDFRLQNDPEIKKRWAEKMAHPRFIHSTRGLYEQIGFQPPALQ